MSYHYYDKSYLLFAIPDFSTLHNFASKDSSYDLKTVLSPF